MLAFTIAFAASLAPGVYAYVSSRGLPAHRDDPLLPERLLARTQRLASSVVLAVGLSIVLADDYAPLWTLLAITATLVGGFPARRKVFDESWGLFGYLGHVFRFWLAMACALFLIMSIPAAMARGGEHAGLPIGSFLAVLAVGYTGFASRLFPWILGSRPLDRAELEPSFEAVLSKARCARPRLLEADAPGGSFFNAFALPSIGTPAVLFTGGLLRSLDAREATAIFAHEVAHLEHHGRRRSLVALGATAVLGALTMFLFAGPFADVVAPFRSLWPLVLLVVFMFKARARRAHETESDLRGAELCGDHEALVSGLTKLHGLMRLPRRLRAKHESRSSHPSLSRRIQAIRRAHAESGRERAPAPAPAPAPVDPRVFFAANASRRALVFETERLHLLRDVDPTSVEEALTKASERRSFPYAELGDLHLDVRTNEIVVVEPDGRSNRLKVTPAEALELSELLDRIDVELPFRQIAPTGRIASLVVALMGLSGLTAWTVLLTAMLAAALPSVATLAAAGAAGLAASALGAVRVPSISTTSVLLLAGASIGCLWVAWRRREVPEPRGAPTAARVVPAVLVLFGAASALIRFHSQLPLMSLHLWARDALGGVIALAACSAALATAKDPKLRWLSLATAASCVLLTALGSLTVGARFGEDVFARAPEPLAETTAALEPLRSVALPDTIVDLVLSPSGTHFFARLDSGESYGPAGFLVETSAGLERVDVLALDFVDDDTVATVVEVEVDVDVDVEEGEGNGNGNGLVLSLPGLSVPLPALRPVELSVDAREGAWQIVGYDADLYDTIVLRGRLDSDRIETRRFVLPDSDTSVVDAVSFSGWALSYDYLYPDAFHRAASLGFAGLTTRGMATELAVRRHDGDTRRVGLTLLYPSCYEAGLSEPLFVCSVGHGGATRLYTIDPRSPAFAPFGSVGFERHLDGPITRGRLALTGWHEAPLLVDIARARVVRVPLADAPWEIVAWSGDTVANATYQYDTETTTVTLYRLDVAPPLH